MKSGIVLLPVNGALPDKWKYSYDGKTLAFEEDFGSNEELKERTQKFVQTLLGRPAAEENGCLKITFEVSQEEAILILLSEIAMQAAVLGVVPLVRQAQLIEDIKFYRPILSSLSQSKEPISFRLPQETTEKTA